MILLLIDFSLIVQKSASHPLLAFLLVVGKYSNSGYIYLLPDLSPTGNIRVQEEIKSVFYYSITINRKYKFKI